MLDIKPQNIKSDDVKNDFAGQGANIESVQRRFRGKRDINQRALFFLAQGSRQIHYPFRTILAQHDGLFLVQYM